MNTIKTAEYKSAEEQLEFYNWLQANRLFFVDEVRQWLKQLYNEEISMSKFVELFNEKVFASQFKTEVKDEEQEELLEQDIERILSATKHHGIDSLSKREAVLALKNLFKQRYKI